MAEANSPAGNPNRCAAERKNGGSVDDPAPDLEIKMAEPVKFRGCDVDYTYEILANAFQGRPLGAGLRNSARLPEHVHHAVVY